MRRAGNDVADFELLAGPSIPWPATWTAQGVIATLEPLAGHERAAKLRAVIGKRVGSVTVLMDAPHDPHNGGAILRSCEAFGVPEVHVVPRDERFLVGRTVTRGCERWVDVVIHPSAAEAVSSLAARGFHLVATHPNGALSPEDLATLPRVALLLGNEHSGIRHELAQAAHSSVRIPMRGFVESLNVSVAAAVLLSAATRDREGDLTLAERELLYAKGLFHSLARARDILWAAQSPA
ncbi:MAG TPA: RNA methyltransferase [Polyangiaceae bacterium]|nr:RNA methyltransferase [Polyangiaceae bacterium]